MKSVKHWMAAGLSAAFVFAAVSEAGAQVRYRHAPDPYDSEAIYPFGVPDADSRSGSLTFEVQPYAPRGPVVRVGRRCAYPNGWNVTDFSRDVNGIPPGRDHVCPDR